MSAISTVFGLVLLIFVWSAACVAFKRKFWFIMGGIYCLLGALDIATWVFILSPACTSSNGVCQVGYSAILVTTAGIFWFTAAAFCFQAAVENKSMEYAPVATNMVITEHVEPDGSKVVETVSYEWTGKKTTERKIFKNAQAKESGTGEIGLADGSSTEFHEADAIQDQDEKGTRKEEETEL